MVAPCPGGPSTVTVVPRRKEPSGKRGASGGGTGRVRPATGVAGLTRSASPAGRARGERVDDGSPAWKANICSYFTEAGPAPLREPNNQVSALKPRRCHLHVTMQPACADALPSTPHRLGSPGTSAPPWARGPRANTPAGTWRRPTRCSACGTGRPTDGGRRPNARCQTFRWGLIPWWSKDTKSASRLINARRETVLTKPSFREAFEKRRIIVPADGFYEWRRTKSGGKQPHFFTRADGAPMALAGLAERWRDKNLPPDAPAVRSCTIITTTAGPDMEGIHDRMPVLLDPATFDLWLDPANEDVEELRALLAPLPAGRWRTIRSGRASATSATTIRR